MNRKVREHFDRMGRENERLIDEELHALTLETACRLSEAILKSGREFLPLRPETIDPDFVPLVEMIRRHRLNGRHRRTSRAASSRRRCARRNGR